MFQYIFKSRSILFSILFLLPFFLGSSNTPPDENDNFYLSNYTTFAPGSEVIINVYTTGNSSKNFKLRLLKIDDPVNFFLSADKNNIHYQFDVLGTNKDNLLNYTSLVRSWEESVNSNQYNGYSKNFNLGKINSPGIYILQAIRNDYVAYCGIVVTEYTMIYKSSPGSVLAVLTNSNTGEFLNNVKFSMYTNSRLTDSQISSDDGIVMLKTAAKETSDLFRASDFIIAETGDEVVLNDPYRYFNNGGQELMSYVYTNQPVYRPGQEVFFKSIFRKRMGNDLQNAAGEKFNIIIKSPRNKEVYSGELTTNDFGTIADSFILDEEADLGIYTIMVNREQYQYHGSFSVEEYKKPEYQVKVTTSKGNYSRGDVIEGNIAADYYFGSPVTEGDIHLFIYRQNYWRPWWYWSEYAWFYRGYGMEKVSYYGDRQLIHEETGRLDKEGKFSFSYKADEDVQFDYTYTIRAEVTDNSRRAISGNADVFITRGSFSIFTTPDKYFVESGKTVNLRVNAADFSDKPILTDFKVMINFPDNDRFKDRPRHQVTLNGRTDELGKAVIPFIPPSGISGHFNYVVTAFDEKGREITAQGSFFTGTREDYFYGRGSGLEIITDKDAYEKGDSLSAFISVPYPGMDILLTYESNEVIEYRKLHAEGTSIAINEKLDKRFSPGFNITVSLVRDRQFYNTSKMIGVLDKERVLSIDIHPEKEIYKPGQEAVYNVTVRDNTGRAVPDAEFSFGLVDESIYAVRADETQPIHNFFFAPQYSYIPTYNTLQMNYYNGMSRKATRIDKELIKDLRGMEKGDSRLFGRILFKGNNNPVINAQLIISGEQGYHKTVSDSTGNYSFDKIKSGRYDIYLMNNQQLSFVESIEVKKLTEHNIELNQSEISSMDLLQADGEIRGGRADETLMSLAPREKKMEANGYGDSYVAAELRSDFKDAAFWQAVLKTDSQGKAVVKIKLPDNLTTWRTTVKAITKGTQAGEERNTVISRKDLLVRMETPRFFREGDELVISTLVHNYLNENKKTKITFKAENVEVISSSINSDGYGKGIRSLNGSYEVNINRNSEIRIDWKVRVNNPAGTAVLFAEALTNEESDAMKLDVPLLPKGFREMDNFVVNLSEQSGEEEFRFNIPGDVDIRTARFSFTSAPSLSGTLLKAVDELAGYPYGCVEQTMSRFLPTIIAANTFKEMNIPVRSTTLEELPKMVNAGLKRLYGFQHEDGGWGWWTNDKSNPYMSAYVIYGLSLAKKAGYNISEEVFLKGIENLKQQVLSFDESNNTTYAFMLYALSTSYSLQRFNYKDYAGRIDDMLDKKLNAYSLSLLALAAKNWDSPAAAKLTEKLRTSVIEKDNLAYWSGENWHYNWQEDKVQSTAFAVKALLNINGQSELTEKAVRWLLLQKQGFSWHSTQETAAVIFALTDYLSMTGELNPDFKYRILVNGKELASKHFSYEDILTEPEEIRINGTEGIFSKGSNSVKIIKEGKGKLYFSAVSEYYTMNERSAAKVNNFRIRREYYPLSMEQRGDRIVYTKGKFDGTIKSGTEILVKTFVESNDDGLQYFVLEDMLPSGFESVKEEQNYEIEGENNYRYYDKLGAYHRPWIWHYADKEYRDEKVAFFVTQITNSMEFSYIIKAQIPGEYTAAPANGYLMYYPEVSGNSGMINIEVVE